jgi:hypothetical protein
MEAKDIIMIGAVLIAPVLAVQVQKYLEKIRENKNRKIRLFYALISTRTSRVSYEHVQALNMIDIEFYGKIIFKWRFQTKKEKSVQNSWKEYHDHLNSKMEQALWNQKSDDLFVALLYNMAKALNYDFDKVELKRNAYSPIAHGEYENDNLIIRQSLAKILSGEKPLPMKLEQLLVSDEELAEQKKLRELLIEFLEGKMKIPVKITKE